MFSRDVTLIIHSILDKFVPPFLRDCKWFMRPIIKLAYGSYADAVMGFKDKFPFMSEDQLLHYYETINEIPINKRPCDLNTACLNYILNNINGSSVLDAACGRGALLIKIKEKYTNLELYGFDFAPPRGEGITCIQANICSIPFEDHQFDTVICTHALEHIRDYKKAIDELIRVTNRRLIIVVPKQREYKYTPDLHIHFFPYLYSFKSFIGIENAKYLELNGDFLCSIDIDEHFHR